jgi:hypothetical protein
MNWILEVKSMVYFKTQSRYSLEGTEENHGNIP